MTKHQTPNTRHPVYRAVDIRIPYNCTWKATDWIVVDKHSGHTSNALYYARNHSLRQETPALGSRDDVWAALLSVLKCYNDAVFIRATDAMRILQTNPEGFSTPAFARKWYHPERGHRGAKLKGGPRVPVVKKYLRSLSSLGVVERKRVRNSMLRWTVTPRGRAMLQLRKWWDEHKAAKEAARSESQ